MSVFHENMLIGSSGQGAPAAAGISRSLRFNSSDSAYLSRTPASAGNRKTWTWAGWVKRSKFDATRRTLFRVNSSPETHISFAESAQGNAEALFVYGASGGPYLLTTAVFRDPSAWYHIVVAFDTAQATASNRVKIYVNGTQVTAFNSPTYPNLNYDGGINSTGLHAIGASATPSEYHDGYLADIHFIDGQALDPSSFTEVSATTGQLIPKTYSGSYGTNGFQLKFADNSSNTAATLGKDTSGNGNNWTPNNLSVFDGIASVAAATGALPIYNTTGTYGDTKGTGTRTDTNSSSIVLAVPMDGTNNGTTFTDESATIKGSGSAKSITRNGDTKTSTTQSKFYGSSGYFDGSGDYLTAGTSSDYIFGTGDFTVECWAYFSTLNADNALITNHNNDSNWVFKVVSGKLQYYPGDGNGSSINGTSTIKTGSWYHFSATRQSGTFRLFVNGVLETTATVTANYTVNNTLYIGAQQNNLAGTYLNGYLQDARIYKGVAKYTSNFNPPSSTQNPSIAAGNDSLVDVPTNGSQTDTGVGGEVRGNYCTLNPLDKGSNVTLTNGNLDVSTNSTWNSVRATFGITSGKWYWEYTMTAAGYTMVGIGSRVIDLAGYIGQSSAGYAYYSLNGNKWNSGSAASYGSSFTTNDVVGVAFDADAGKIWFSKNGTWQASGDPAAGTNAAYSSIPSGTYFPTISQDNSLPASTGGTLNAGARPFAYTAPSGFKALCTANLPAPVVTKPSTVMDVVTYTGTGATRSITGLGFSPDFVWIKERGATGGHNSYDIVRGASVYLASESTSAEGTDTDALTSFNSDGFSLGSGYTVKSANGSGRSYVAWTWDAGSSTVTNTQGSITSQVRANVSAGFSVVSYTGTGAVATVGHGLGVAPQLIIARPRNAVSNWIVYHASEGAGKFLRLNTTDSSTTDSTAWNNTTPTSTVYSVGNNAANGSGLSVIAYCFAPVVGYSSFGSYTGNGSTNGPFVYTGFRPRWIMIKNTTTTAYPTYTGWAMFDSSRTPYNVAVDALWANSSQQEGLRGNGSAATSADFGIDFLSNGFKLRDNNASELGLSGATYIYCAFAESPFNYSRAR